MAKPKQRVPPGTSCCWIGSRRRNSPRDMPSHLTARLVSPIMSGASVKLTIKPAMSATSGTLLRKEASEPVKGVTEEVDIPREEEPTMSMNSPSLTPRPSSSRRVGSGSGKDRL